MIDPEDGVGPMSKVPVKHYQLMKRRHPEVMAAVEQLGKVTTDAGPLDDKVKHLVQLGAAAALHSEGAVHSHTRRALEAGATAEDIHHALLLLTSTIGFPTVMAAISWADDVIDKRPVRVRSV
jgi:4-carboxymuconolactone decarboxylase